MKRIILIGYMGAGKTTLGKMLAREMVLDFIDLDCYIENRYRKTVSALFQERGEDGFRLLEQRMLHEVAEFEDVLISSGGGTPCFFDNMQYMKQQAVTVYLKASPDVLAAHLRMGKQQRPLIAQKNDDELMAYIRESLEQREPYYSQADLVFDIARLDNSEAIKASVERLLEELKQVARDMGN